MAGSILYPDSSASGVRTGDIKRCGCRSCAGKTLPGQLGDLYTQRQCSQKEKFAPRYSLQLLIAWGSRTKMVGYNISIE
jgi:hypothetical protein